MSVVNVTYGYKIFNYILVPKKYYYIPEISNIEFSIIMCSYYRELNENLTNNIKTMIINRINNTNKFYIYNVSPHSTTLCLNEIHMLDLVKINIEIINESITEFSNLRTEQSDKFIKTFITKNIFKNQKITSDITITKIGVNRFQNRTYPQPINYILLVPYMFYIDNIAYKKYSNYDYSTLAFLIENKKVDHLSILFKINNTRNYNFINSNINKIEKYNIGNWRLYADLIELLTFMFNKKIIYDICFDYNLLKNYNPSIIKIYINSTLFNKKINILKLPSIKNDLNMNIINSDIILNGKLLVNFDDKLILKHIFDKSILPLSENIGLVRILYDDFLTRMNLDVSEPRYRYDINDIIFDAIIQRITSLCQHKDFVNKKFIIKDANGSQGIGISGFNCINYNSISKELKKIFIEKLFNNRFFTTEINTILDTHLLVQEFISSPTINIPRRGDYKFKTRIYILLEQNTDLTINFHLNKLINLDFMHNFNPDSFFNIDLSNSHDIDAHVNQFISNYRDEDLGFVSSLFQSDLTLLKFDYDLKLKLFLTNFAKQFSVILKNFESLFIDLLGASINKKIFKVLSIDAIFDENDDNNIKILEINTAGAIYEYFENIYEYILNGRLRNFHSIFNVNLDEITTSKKYLSNIIKVKINYDQ